MGFLYRASLTDKKHSDAMPVGESQSVIRSTMGGSQGGEPQVQRMMALLADAGCTLYSSTGPPCMPSDPYKFRSRLENCFSTDQSLVSTFLSGFALYTQSPQNMERILKSGGNWSIVRELLLVAPLQLQLQYILLEKLPEYFNTTSGIQPVHPCLEEANIPGLILNHLRWLDFLVDVKGLSEKLFEVLSICPLQLKKEIIGSLPEILGGWSDSAVISSLEMMLKEDSEVVVPVLESFSNLNWDEQLQEQVVTIALSCIRTIHAEQMPFLLRFLLFSATSKNVQRIIPKIRDNLKFVCVPDPNAASHKKLKGKCLTDNVEASILEALRSSLRFKNILSETILKELKSLDEPHDHKVIDVWLLMLIYSNGGSLQKSVEKVIKRKIINGCLQGSLFEQCLQGQKALVQEYFSAFLSVADYLLACKEQQARDFGIYLYTSLFEELVGTYFRQEVLGLLVTHVGSGRNYEVNSALDAMVLLTSKHSEELLPLSSYISGLLDYLEGFSEDCLHKVYKVFSNLAMCARVDINLTGASLANELFMILRKQVGNADLKYKRMGIIGTFELVSLLGHVDSSSSQRTNVEEALELLRLSLDSCKMMPSPLILFYNELILMLESESLHTKVIEWVSKHVGDFELKFLNDIEGGQLLRKKSYGGLEGELWMNLDGDISPICLNILPVLHSSMQRSEPCLQVLPVNFLLLSVVERLTNQGSLEGIDALLGCPLHLPSPKYFVAAEWKSLTAKQKQIVGLSLYYAANWIRELLNAFCTQISGKVDCMTQSTREEMISKLLKRIRNLVFLENLLNRILKLHPISLPELCLSRHSNGSAIISGSSQITGKKRQKASLSTPGNNKRKSVHNAVVEHEKLDMSRKLRQPTILDVLKRTGAVISQDMAEGSTVPSHKDKNSESLVKDAFDESLLVEIPADSRILDAQKFKFRPLYDDCFSILSFSKGLGSCCSDPRGELPLHLYLLHDLHHKLDQFTPYTEFPTLSPSLPTKAPTLIGRINSKDFFNKIRPLFTTLKKHLDTAVCLFEEDKHGQSVCEEHWKTESAFAGNPDMPCVVVSKLSVAVSVISETLHCFSKILNLPDLFLLHNFSALSDLLGAFQPINMEASIVSCIQPFPSPGNIDYLYCGAHSFFEGLLDKACSISPLLGSKVLFTLESLINSTQLLLEKLLKGNEKNLQRSILKVIQPFLRNRLGICAHKLLLIDWDVGIQDADWKSKGDMIEKILHIYLANNNSTSILDELACSILSQVPLSKNISTSDAAGHGFPTLCHKTFVIWYRVLHEENLAVLSNLIEEISMLEKARAQTQPEAVKRVLIKLQQCVKVVVVLVNMCRSNDKIAMHTMAMKYGGKFVDLLLKAFEFFRANFDKHHEDIVQMVKELQKATRTIQTLCSEAKGTKRTVITSKIPGTKRSMERFLFQVKGLFHNTSNGATFWMGNLKHKDLHGQVVSSQVYATEEEMMTSFQHSDEGENEGGQLD
ncbi:hypothetical protein H6P81_020002 [Aristolochia fimbriata]|uniref:Fanconi anemia group D2 protein n=1 Tax=Aristolochia fimbriata TaxID=158543 RepID=A0AAV7DTA0_ARIFI|nr:hypothetical protein H6P81_020002 [Aristolochia fimbriata]